MKYFMVLFETFPWLSDPALILVLISVGSLLRLGSRLADEAIDSVKILASRFKHKR